MAEINDIVSKEAINELVRLNNELNKTDDVLASVIGKFSGMMKGGNVNGFKDMANATKQATEAQKDLNRASEAGSRINKEAAAQLRKIAAETEKARKKEEERLAALKLTVKSIGDAERQNKALRETIKSLDLTTKQGKDTLQQYNTALNKNTEFIRVNSDAATKQRMNIGNYQSALNGVTRAFGALTAIWGSATFLRSSYSAFEEQEKANRRLMFALQGNKEAYAQLTEQASKLQSETGVDEESIQQIQMLGVSAGRSTQEIVNMVNASLALSSATGMDLQAAYMQLASTLNGVAGKAIPKLGTDFANLTTEQLKSGDAIDLINDRFGELAKNSATNSSRLQRNWGELMEKIGSGIATVVNPALEYLNDLFSSKEYKKENNINFFGIRKRSQFSGKTWAERKKEIEEENKKKEENTKVTYKAVQAEDDLARAKIHSSTATEKQKTALESYIELMEEAYERMKILEEFNVPNGTFGMFNAAMATAAGKGLTPAGGSLSGRQRSTPGAYRANDPGKGFTSEEWQKLSLESAQTMADMTFQIIANADQAAYDNKIALLEKEKEAKLSNANLTEKERAKIEADYAKKTAKLKEEQFKKQKASSIIQSLINTALAVVNALAFGGAAAPVMAIAAGIAGAAQTAIIAAQPIPQFDSGTLSTPANFVAGEQRPEWMRMPSGQWRYVDRPTMFKNLAGATVIGGKETERMMKAGIHPGIDPVPAINDMKKEIVQAIKNKREIMINGRTGAITEREGNYYKTYFNRYASWPGKN